MVGYRGERDLSSSECAVAGAVSGVVTRATASPLDILKIRFQLQIESIKRTAKGHFPKYTGVGQAVGLIWKEEGIRAFWKGQIPGQLMSIVYGIVQFAAFENLTQILTLSWGIREWGRPVLHFVCGGVSGCFATLCAQPLDVLRTRLVAQGEPKIYRNVVHAFTSMYQNEGGRSLYKGLTPTLLQIFPHAGCQFGFYELFRKIWNLWQGHRHALRNDVGTFESLVCGASAGICSKAVVYPLDLIKKRLQVQGFEAGRASFGVLRQYNSFQHAFQLITMEEGLRGLYKGFLPSMMKAALAVGVTFSSYELTCNFMRTYKSWTPYVL